MVDSCSKDVHYAGLVPVSRFYWGRGTRSEIVPGGYLEQGCAYWMVTCNEDCSKVVDSVSKVSMISLRISTAPLENLLRGMK